MNSTAVTQQFNLEVSHELCAIHAEPKLITGGGPICGTCAKEKLNQANREHQKQVDTEVRQKTLCWCQVASPSCSKWLC